MTKLELMRPGALQRKTLTVNRSKLAKPGGGAGPLKAVGASNMQRPAVESATAAGPKGEEWQDAWTLYVQSFSEELCSVAKTGNR